MPDFLAMPCTAFAGSRRLAKGPLIDVALAVKAAEAHAHTAAVLVFDDATGAVIDLDLRGSSAEIAERLVARGKRETQKTGGEKRTDSVTPASGPGRPRLGVVAREVTLLPRHWDWLAKQSGGASAVLRRLVEDGIRSDGGRSSARAAQEACYRFCTTLAGNLPGYEEAMRALYRGDAAGFSKHTAKWPKDVRMHARRLAAPPEGVPAKAE